MKFSLAVSGQQIILKNIDDDRKLSVHIYLQLTGIVLQILFTGGSPKVVNVLGGSQIYRQIINFLLLIPTYNYFPFQLTINESDSDLFLTNQLWHLCQWNFLYKLY